MTRQLLDFDPVTGITTYHQYDELTDQTVIETIQDVEPILERNKALQKELHRDDFWWRAASIPLAVVEKWLREDGVDVFNKDHWPAVKRKLNSSEYRWLRTGTFEL